MYKNQSLWLFEKKDKWTCRVNAKFLWELFQTTGLPPEIVIDAINDWSIEERLLSKLKSWVEKYEG